MSVSPNTVSTPLSSNLLGLESVVDVRLDGFETGSPSVEIIWFVVYL